MLLIAYVIVTYVLGSIGLYKISKKRELPYSWTAWVPILNTWKLGNVADYSKQRLENSSHYGLTLITLQILSIIMIIATWSFSLSAIVWVVGICLDGDYNPYSLLNQIVIPIILIVIYCAIEIIKSIFIYIAQYHTYKLCSENYTVFTVLSILFGISPFFLFAIRNNPDRKVEADIGFSYGQINDSGNTM